MSDAAGAAEAVTCDPTIVLGLWAGAGAGGVLLGLALATLPRRGWRRLVRRR